jgi:hypothetical protein
MGKKTAILIQSLTFGFDDNREKGSGMASCLRKM